MRHLLTTNCVNTGDEDQTIQHVPWSTVGSRGKHLESPERQGSGRHNNRELREYRDHFRQRGGQRGDRGEQRKPDW